jgi:hypothetical protein
LENIESGDRPAFEKLLTDERIKNKSNILSRVYRDERGIPKCIKQPKNRDFSAMQESSQKPHSITTNILIKFSSLILLSTCENPSARIGLYTRLYNNHILSAFMILEYLRRFYFFFKRVQDKNYKKQMIYSDYEMEL